jgi:potassium uptake Trk family protein
MLIEYGAIQRLLVIVASYFTSWQFFVFVSLGVYVSSNSTMQDVMDRNGVNGWWWAIFHSISAFNNAGFALFSDSLAQFSQDPFVLFALMFLILAGNTGFPIMLRFIVWISHRFTHKSVNSFKFLLKMPRRCFTHLFSAEETRVLILVLLGTTLFEMFLVLFVDWQMDCLHGFSTPGKVLVAFFQSISTRTAGFQVIDLGVLGPGVNMVSIGMMYLSSYPLAIAIRKTNRKRKLDGNDELWNSIRGQARKLLFKDFTWIYLAMVFVCFVEEDAISNDPDFAVFKVIFEIVSAYGTVGLSLGYPNKPYSFSGVLQPASKWCLVCVMLLGRHRGLPDNIDRAVQIPIMPQGPSSTASLPWDIEDAMKIDGSSMFHSTQDELDFF